MDGSVTIIRRQVKHARLRVREDTSVQLIVPQAFEQAEIDRIMRKKAAWIEQHQRFFRIRAANASQVIDLIGENVLAPAANFDTTLIATDTDGCGASPTKLA